MAHRRTDVVDRALAILQAVGLPDLTMRRLGAELGVQASAIYHHFPNKQALLGAVADEIVARGPQPAADADASWPERVVARCTALRAAVLAYPDGADVVATMFAFGLGGRAPHDDLVGVLEEAGLPAGLAGAAARTLLHFVHGHAIAEQAHAQAARLGAIESPATDQGSSDEFATGLAIIVEGIAARAAARTPR